MKETSRFCKREGGGRLLFLLLGILIIFILGLMTSIILININRNTGEGTEQEFASSEENVAVELNMNDFYNQIKASYENPEDIEKACDVFYNNYTENNDIINITFACAEFSLDNKEPDLALKFIDKIEQTKLTNMQELSKNLYLYNIYLQEGDAEKTNYYKDLYADSKRKVMEEL